MLNANSVPSTGGGKRTTLDAGTYPARIVAVIDMGLQTQRAYQGEAKPPARELTLTYELLDEFMKDEDGQDLVDKPRWISETFPFHNLVADRARSTIRYKSLDPAVKHEGNFAALVGMPCNVTIVINPGKNKNAGKIFENVGGVSPMRPKDAEKAAQLVNSIVVFDLDAPTMDTWKDVPKWLQDKIKGNLEFEGSALQKLIGSDPTPPKEKTEANKEPAETDDQPY